MAINGAVAYAVTVQGTDDTMYLSTNTVSLVKDYTNSPNGDFIDPYRPYCSDTGVNLHQASVSFPGYSYILSTVTPGHIAKSYLYDFYFRIHLNVYSIQLGNVLSEQTQYFTIWNAYLDNRTLSSVTVTNLADLNLTFNSTSYDPYTGNTAYTSISVPHTFTPLEYVRGTINIPASGLYTINGSYSFEFSSDSPDLIITGQRIVLWPYNSLVAFKETRTYLTDIIESRTNEQRYSLREVPRLSLEYDYIFLSIEEFSNAKQLAKAIAHLPVAVPHWTEVSKLLNLTSGQTVVYLNTTYLELSINQPVVFWKNWNTWEIQEILLVYADRIVLKQGLADTYSYCWFAPVKIGYTNNGIALNSNAGSEDTGALAITSVDNYYNNTWYGNTFQTFPLWEKKAVVTNGVDNKYRRVQESIDTPTGLISAFDLETYNRTTSKVNILCTSQKELFELRRNLDYLNGKYRTFFLPTFKDDLTAVTTIVIGTASLKVNYINVSTYPIKYIYIQGKDTTGIKAEAFEVISITNNFDGTETLAFAVAATKNIPNIFCVSFILKVRLDTDTIEYNHLGKHHTTCNIVVKEVN